MTDITSSFNDIQKIIDILNVVKNKIDNESEMIYSTWDTPKDAIEEIDFHIQKLNSADTTDLLTLEVFFMVTGPFQELSMQNGWSKEYLKIARQFDDVCFQLKNKIAKGKN